MPRDAARIHDSKQALLRDLLKRVSRLFYTTLVVVPANVRDQVSLAYLFARAADTVSWRSLAVAASALAIILLWPRLFPRLSRRLPVSGLVVKNTLHLKP